VTLGDFLKVIEDAGPDRAAFFMPTACGPCRFGQYAPYLRQVLRELGREGVPVFSPTSSDGYDGVAVGGNGFIRTGWRALVAADALRKVLLKTRPYEVGRGDADAALEASLKDVCSVLEVPGLDHTTRLKRLVAAMGRSQERFRAVPVRRERRPLIGVVGEIFCRLNTFSNQDLVRRIEAHGGECWLSDIAEWVAYTNDEQQDRLRDEGRRFSLEMGKARLKAWIQGRDEQAVYEPLREELRGYEEPHVHEVLARSAPYLPHQGALGEMVLSVGKAISLWEKGAAGVVDISPFSCMNGIVCEAIYPRVSAEHDDIPIRVFYFDGTQSDLDRDVGMFMELARTYKRQKGRRRAGPDGRV
jgi:predicted nucleotide-binding protein (sugar kinase/HSP70/actin superfamily)